MPNITKKFNILMATPLYFPDTGGTEMHVYEVGRRLARQGVKVTLLTTIPHDHTHPVAVDEDIEGMHVVRLPVWNHPSDFYIAPKIRSFMKQGQWDLVHCQGCHTLFSPLVMHMARAERIPYLATFHSGGHSSRLRTRLRKVHWKALRPLLADAKKLVGVSEFEAHYFRSVLQLPENQFAVIPNGFTLPEVPPSPLPETNAPIIVSVGRLERYKGHQNLIQALPLIHKRYPRARVSILGSGPYEAALHNVAAKAGVAEYVSVQAIPAGERQAMMDQISQASLVTSLSEYESQGIAVLEALALQRPVLVTDISALHEFVEKKLARAVDLHCTSEELANAVFQQLDNPLIPDQLDLPTWDDCAEHLLTLYETIIH